MRKLVATDGPHMVAASLKGGCDMECPSGRSNYLDFTPQALSQKLLNISDVDTALRRKFVHFVALGELDGPQDVPYQLLGAESVDTTEHRLLALSVAEQAMTLFKNDPPAGSTGK